jgi:hypothetical protein
MSQAQRFLAFFASTVAVVLVLAVLGPRLLGAAAGPEVEVLTSLKLAERKLEPVPLGWGTLFPTALQYQRMNVTTDDPEHALVTATLDFVGNLQRPGQPFRTSVSSLGLERVSYTLRDRDWVVTGSTLERLRSILVALEDRRRSLEAIDHDAGVARRVYRVDAWYIRSERDEVLVGEDWRLQEDRSDRPVDEAGRTRLTLSVQQDGGFTVLP